MLVSRCVTRLLADTILRRRKTDARTVIRCVLRRHRTADFATDKDRRNIRLTLRIGHAHKATWLTKLDSDSMLNQQLTHAAGGVAIQSSRKAHGSMHATLVADFRAFDPRSTERSVSLFARPIDVNHRLTTRRSADTSSSANGSQPTTSGISPTRMPRQASNLPTARPDITPGRSLSMNSRFARLSRRVDIAISRQLIQHLIRRSRDEAKLRTRLRSVTLFSIETKRSGSRQNLDARFWAS